MSVPRNLSSSGKILGTLLPPLKSGVVIKPKDEIINIPQKCYGIITPDTRQSVQGLCTDGLYSCTGIVVLAQSEGGRFVFLCHADAQTKLNDAASLHSIQGWINSLPSSVKRVDIQYDYDMSVKAVMDDVVRNLTQSNPSRMISLIPIEDNLTGILVWRDGRVLRGGDVTYDYVKTHEINNSSDIEKYLGDIMENVGEDIREPICVFDGKTVLSKDQIFSRQSWVQQASVSVEKDITEEIGAISALGMSDLPDSDDDAKTARPTQRC